MKVSWIPSGASLPKDLEDVILFDKREGKSLGFYFEETGRFIRTTDGNALLHVTHWIPLPPDPER